MKHLKLFEQFDEEDENPANFDHDKYIEESDDIYYLKELLRFINMDIDSMDPANFKMQARMNGVTPEEYVNKMMETTLRRKKVIERRIKELS